MSKEYYSNFTEQKYSKTDFIALLTKRIKKYLRKNTPLDMKTNYCLYEKGALTKIIVELLTEIFEKRLNLIIVPEKSEIIKESVLLDDSYLEKYVAKRTKVFFERQNIKKLKENNIPILKTITFLELSQLKELFNIEGKLEEESLGFIENLNHKYSQTKSSFLKSFNHINKLLK
jgi:hypothetical protein